jgi:GDSL-like Lipase/Acylhydrolase family
MTLRILMGLTAHARQENPKHRRADAAPLRMTNHRNLEGEAVASTRAQQRGIPQTAAECAMTSPLPPAQRRITWRQLRLTTKLCLVALFLLLLTGGLEVIARLYWWRVKHVFPITPEAVWRTTYHEVATSGIDGVAPNHGDGTFDVLLLGGSVLHASFGDIASRLQTRLAEKLGRPVRVINLAFHGRTSAESRMKYERLADRRFDLVVLYHGINDAFLNNCPPGAFRADYTHVRHIAQMKALDRHPEIRWFVLPYTLGYVARNVADRWALDGCPRSRWSHYAADLRTPPAFEANLEAVAQAAERRGDPLLLATFAYHLPEDYTDEAFQAKRLSYDKHLYRAACWGEPQHLRRALDAHNNAVRAVAARHGALFADVAGQLPHGKLCFDDPCHLNAEGCRRFVELIVASADPSRLGNRQARR